MVLVIGTNGLWDMLFEFIVQQVRINEHIWVDDVLLGFCFYDIILMQIPLIEMDNYVLLMV